MTNQLTGVAAISQETYDAMAATDKIGWTSVTAGTKIMYAPKGFVQSTDGRYVPTRSHTTIATTYRIFKQPS